MNWFNNSTKHWNIREFLVSNMDVNILCNVALSYKMSMLVMVWFLSICMSLWLEMHSCNNILNKFYRMIETHTKVVDIIYFSKLLFICFGVSVLQIFSTTFVSLGVHICFCGRAQKRRKERVLILQKNHGCFNIIRNKRVK